MERVMEREGQVQRQGAEPSLSEGQTGIGTGGRGERLMDLVGAGQ